MHGPRATAAGRLGAAARPLPGCRPGVAPGPAGGMAATAVTNTPPRKRPPWPRNDRHNHGSNAPFVRVDRDKLARDAALQARNATDQAKER